MLQAVEDVGRSWYVAYEVVSCAEVALTLLVRLLPHLHLHPRHLLHPFLENPQALCVRVVCHTTTISPIANLGSDYIRRSISSRSPRCLQRRTRTVSCYDRI
jgi:hypothetical protein